MIRFSNLLRNAETPGDYRVERISIMAAQDLNAPFGGVMQKTLTSGIADSIVRRGIWIEWL